MGPLLSDSAILEVVTSDVNKRIETMDRKRKLAACISCGDIAKTRCSVCKAGYCSRSCQENDWYDHKSNCTPPPPLEDIGAATLPIQDPSSPIRIDRLMPALEIRPVKTSFPEDVPDCKPTQVSITPPRQNGLPSKAPMPQPRQNSNDKHRPMTNGHNHPHMKQPPMQRPPMDRQQSQRPPMDGNRSQGPPIDRQQNQRPPVNQQPRINVAPPARPIQAMRAPSPQKEHLPVPKAASPKRSSSPSLPSVAAAEEFFRYDECTFVSVQTGQTSLIVRDVDTAPVVFITPQEKISLVQDLQVLSEEMQKYCNSQTERRFPSLGEVVLAKFPSDGLWYRAAVCLMEDQTDEIQVVYIDYGNMELIKKADVIKMQPQFMKLPILAVHATIKGLPDSLSQPEFAKLKEILPADVVVTANVIKSPDGFEIDIVSHASQLAIFSA